MAKVEILTAGALPATSEATLATEFLSRRIQHAEDALPPAAEIRAIARGGHFPLPADYLERLPKLEIIANFGVGYDGIDLAYAARKGIVVTNTPDVLTEEVADTALGLLLMTVRELSAAERHLRAGKWEREGIYRLTPATLRNRTVGIVGLGRIGLAVARRLDAMKVPVVYHTRSPKPEAPYRHYPDLRAMAEAVDILLVIVPGGAETKNMIDRGILDALGPDGILINVGRGSAVDEPALIDALKSGRLLAAGLDVFADEPHVPEALLALRNAVLLPHVGSASVFTRDAMGQLMVDNLTSWFRDGKPLTPVAETPWPRK